MQNIPIWGQPIELQDWQTQMIENANLHYHLAIPAEWNTSPKVLSTPLEVEHFFQGRLAGEGLIIKFMEKANPKDNLRNWVDVFISLTGFPVLCIQQTLKNPPQLIQWKYEGICPPLTEKLSIDETHLYQGLAQVNEDFPSLIRLYTLLARKNTCAWQINLSIASACLPNTPEEIVEINDHFRAGAVFGNLKLF